MTNQEQRATLGQILEDYKAAKHRRVCLGKKAEKMAEQLILLADGIMGKSQITVAKNDISVQQSSDIGRQEVISLPTREETIELIREMDKAEKDYEKFRSQWDEIKPIE